MATIAQASDIGTWNFKPIWDVFFNTVDTIESGDDKKNFLRTGTRRKCTQVQTNIRDSARNPSKSDALVI